MPIEYKHWKWKKENSVLKKTNIYEPTVKDEIEKEIINIEENKREICNERIVNRDMIIQSKINPFLLKNNYLNDLDDQNKYLIPKNSNYKKKD
jgi:hypothetical protein